MYEHFFLIPSDANTSPDELQKTYPREEQNWNISPFAVLAAEEML